MTNFNNKESFQDLIDNAIKEENFKDLNKFIIDSINNAADLTKYSLNKILNNKNNAADKPYRVCEDDNIINQKPKSVNRAKTWSILAKTSIFSHSVAIVGLLMSFFTHPNLSDILSIVLWCVPALIISFYILNKMEKLKKQIIRFRKYKREIGNNTVIPVIDLAVATSKSKEFTINDLLDLIDKDFFRQARIVENGELFILDSKTYKLYKDQVKKDNIKSSNEKDEERVMDENDKNILIENIKIHITKLANAVESLKQPMKDKITRLLETIRRIFAVIKEQPENTKELSKFIDYYLPTTAKLVDAYSDMQVNPTESVENSLKEIEHTMDTINDAFLKLLDNMYEDKVIDIASDISVLKTMLKQEGLLDDDFELRRK